MNDGIYSERKGKGTAAWVITSPDKSSLITASAISPGKEEMQSSYRSELLGILGILEDLNNICVRNDIKKSSVRWHAMDYQH